MRMSGQVNVHRAAARLAGRELRRRPWRTTLVALLVALPVAVMVLAASLLRTASPPFDVEDRSSFGLADAFIWFGAGSETSVDLHQARQRVAAAAPRARTAVVDEARGTVRGPVGKDRFVRLIGPEDDPMVAARTTRRSGRLPRGAGEVALSPRLARGWQVDVGSTLDLPQLGLRATVVGLAHPLVEARGDTIYVGTMPDVARNQRNGLLFVDVPGDAAAVTAALRTLNASGPLNVPRRNLAAVTPSGALPPESAGSAVPWTTVVGALALAVFGTVIAAAFVVGARRQLRTLGILATNGASPAALRAVVLWQGGWAGLLGSATGLALGATGLAAAWPHRDRFLSYEPPWFTVRPADLVSIVVLGALTALVAAYQPARSVTRLSILTSLAGRRPLAPVPRRVVLAGLAAMAAGTAFLAVATIGGEGGSGDAELWVGIGVLGGLGLLFGSVAVAPAVVGIFGPLATRLRGSPRLALRSLGRQRARTGAVVGAVCAAAALALAASAILASVEGGPTTYLPENMALVEQHSLVELPAPPGPADPASIGPGPSGPASAPPTEKVTEADLAAVAAVVPGARRIEVSNPSGFLVATPEVLDAFEIDAVTRRLLSEHGAVRPGAATTPASEQAPGGAPSAAGPDPAVVQALVEAAVPAPASRYDFVNSQRALLSVERAARHGLGSTTSATAFVSTQPLTDRQREALRDLASSNEGSALRLASAQPPGGRSSQSFLRVEFDAPMDTSPLVIYVVLDGLALLFTGFVIVVGLALAAAETREEAEVLTAVGASPSTLRRLAAAKAALLAGAGVALAVPTGLVPVWVVRNASTGSSRFNLPWASLGLLILVLPAAVALMALVGSAVHGRYRPVTASTMSAD